MISKCVLLKYFTKIDQFNYTCKKCGKDYKTPNGGVGNLRKHYEIHSIEPQDDVNPNKKAKMQSVIAPLNDPPSLIDDPVPLESVNIIKHRII
ncbi:unnamed protein product [Macrosiphum euphorbiae]|uniref:BED-type domain-containing protein n=1 Tax=Macrosiphum euphorbiae TaxID=13131 RepID=A0AAV0XCR1_9HEMI|nr:unnamed protein product [Macrosiphum euphorbiae]